MTAKVYDETPLIRRPGVLGASPIDAYQHTMSVPSLRRYLEIKVHHLIRDYNWARVHVVGAYDRDCVISANEKTGKLFNWQRPTAEVHGDDLIVKCFPGLDYVRHYALIIATYLSMTGRYRGQVDYQLPGESLCAAAVNRLDVDLSADDLVVLGWGLGHFTDGTAWTHGDGCAWQRARVEGRRVLYLGYLHSIWGNAAGCVVSGWPLSAPAASSMSARSAHLTPASPPTPAWPPATAASWPPGRSRGGTSSPRSPLSRTSVLGST